MNIYGYDKNNKRIMLTVVNDVPMFIAAVVEGVDITTLVKEELALQGEKELAKNVMRTLISFQGGKEKALSLQEE